MSVYNASTILDFLGIYTIGSEFQRYLSQLPVSVFPYLNLPLDWDNEYDSDLIEIARHLLRWEELLVRPFKLSRADVHAIKTTNQDSAELQRYAQIFLEYSN